MDLPYASHPTPSTKYNLPMIAKEHPDPCSYEGNSASHMQCVISRLRELNLDPMAIYLGMYYTTVLCKNTTLDYAIYIVVPDVTCDSRVSGKAICIEGVTGVKTMLWKLPLLSQFQET